MERKLFLNKYRVDTIRLKNHDYREEGTYFITICIAKRKRYFGKVIDNQMQLTRIGEIAYKNWLNIPNHFKNVQLDEFIIMPDHMHGIIIILPRGNNERGKK
ncbi:MAG: glucose-6-phosphate dehydrogenase [Candidatus Dojkabacteria bacterium]|nr:glucose-6-phosphate dehydrogenase [Candidatus Dojkabacteria bacterium]